MTKQTTFKNLSISIGFLLCYTTHTLSLPTQNIKIGPTLFTVELADTPETRAKGLMHRNRLPDKTGMLFSYKRPQHVGIWMKNTLIPLDILWISEKKVVFHIEENTLPHSLKIMRPQKRAQYVVELNAGEAKRYKLKIGDKLKTL